MKIGDLGVMRGFASPQTSPRWTTQGNRRIVMVEVHSLIGQVLLDLGEILHRSHLMVLVIGENDHEVGLLGGVRGQGRRPQQKGQNEFVRQSHGEEC